MSSLFGNPSSAEENTSAVKLAVIGTPTAGKTYLMHAVHRLLFGGTTLPLVSGLRLGALSAEDTTGKFNEIEKNITTMRKEPLPSSMFKYDFEFRLLHKTQPLFNVVYHDNKGQILTISDPKLNSARSEFLKTLSRANVIWLLLPLQVDKDGKYLGVSNKDKVLADGYLQDAFERRSSSSPVAFGILLTKADVLDDLESEKAKQELRKLHGELKSHFDWLISCDFISAAALFPVSTLGFGNANMYEGKNNTTPDSNDPLASYILRGNDLKPYNVDKLLMWSLACATQQPPIQDSIDATTEQNILNNYLRLDGLVYSLKDAS